MMDKSILNQADTYYTEKIEHYGATVEGGDWNSLAAQYTRFDQLTKIIERDEQYFSVCDYGCGYGAYVEYLKNRGYSCDYTGIDVSEKMISSAKEMFEISNKIHFIHGSELTQDYDYIIASGIFNVRQDVDDNNWLQYILSVLEHFNAHARKGFAFNCLTKYSDREYMKDYLYYADPLFLFDHAKKNFSKNVSLLHDYEIYDFTILVRKN